MGVTQSYWKRLVQPIFRDRRWLLAWDVLAGASHTAQGVEELGAESVFLVGAGRGQGPIRTERALHLDNRAETLSMFGGCAPQRSDWKPLHFSKSTVKSYV